MYISRDVVFDKNIFPFADLNPTAGARYTSEVLLLPDLPSLCIIDSNVAYDPPVICLNPLNMLPDNFLQPPLILGASDNQLCTNTGVYPPTGTAPHPNYFRGLPGTCSACSQCNAHHDFTVANRS
jgi:hypothetical protein